MKDAIRMRLLIVDDQNDWQDQLMAYFTKAGQTIKGVDLKLAQSNFTQDARGKLKSGFYHAASLDQNMPEGIGGQVVPEEGFDLARNMSETGNPLLFCLYTAFGDMDFAKRVGTETGMPYRLKGAETGGEDGKAMTIWDYCSWFVEDFFIKKYVSRVLEMAAQSGLEDIRKTSRNLLDLEKEAMKLKKLKEMNAFMGELDRLRETLVRYLVALTRAVWGQRGTLPASKSTTGQMTLWLKDTWKSLELGKNKRFLDWKDFMGVSGKESMARVYLDEGLFKLNDMRNKVVHGGAGYDWAVWEDLRPAVFRMMDLLAWLVTRPLIATPSKGRYDLLACVDYRSVTPKDIDLFYPVKDALPRYDPAKTLFTRLTNRDDEALINITEGISLKREDGELRVRRRLVV